jgi:hypothetical protein
MDKFFNTAGPNKPDIHYTLLPKKTGQMNDTIHQELHRETGRSISVWGL